MWVIRVIIRTQDRLRSSILKSVTRMSVNKKCYFRFGERCRLLFHRTYQCNKTNSFFNSKTK